MLFDWENFKPNQAWIKENTIYATIHGSHAYGTNTPESDVDIRGIVIAPRQCYLGISKTFEHYTSSEYDLVLFDVKKFFALASVCNPNALELIFTDPSDHICKKPIADLILNNREMFLSKKTRYTFLGYAHSQLKRVETHRRWILNPPEAPPKRSDFGLPETLPIPKNQLQAIESKIKKQLDFWGWQGLEVTDTATRQYLQDEFTRRLVEIMKWSEHEVENETWFAASRSIGLETNVIEILDKERRYKAAQSDWAEYQKWKLSRNPARFELEVKYGFDTKHAMHLVRLTRSCVDLLRYGTLLIKRHDAKELLEIRNGLWSYLRLKGWFESQKMLIEDLVSKSSLPDECDLDKLDQILEEIIRTTLFT